MGMIRERFTPRRVVSTLTTLGLIVGLVLVTTLSTQAKVPGPNGRIAFARFDPKLGDTVTFTANPDGTDRLRLFPGASSSPHWSPDGTRVVIGACADPPVCDTAAVIVNPDTGAHRVLAMLHPARLFTGCTIWAPNAKRLACEGDGQVDQDLNGVYAIRTSDGGGLTRITHNPGGIDSPIDYSPNGRQIVFARFDPSRDPGPDQALFVVNVDGSDVDRITPWGYADDDGSWSPDGTKIAFEHFGSLFVVHPDGGGLHMIRLAAPNSSAVGDFSWSPDGTKILFLLISAKGPERLATANADGSDVDRLRRSPAFDSKGDWGSHPLAP